MAKKKKQIPALRWVVIGDQHFMFIGNATHPVVELKIYNEEYRSGDKVNYKIRSVLNAYRLGREVYPREVNSKVKVYKFYEDAAVSFLNKFIGE